MQNIAKQVVETDWNFYHNAAITHKQIMLAENVKKVHRSLPEA